MRATTCLAVSICACAIACGPGNKDSTEGLMTIEVLPANSTLTYTGSPVTLDYTAVGHYADGHSATLNDPVFSLDTAGQYLGTFADATFSVSGAAGGKGGVVATLGTVNGQTSVAVVVHLVNTGMDVPPNGGDNFPDDPPMTANSPRVVYPLDNAVMPTSVKSPDVQWEGPNAAGDLYRVRITAGAYATVDTILAAGPAFKLDNVVSDPDWRMLVRSAANEPLAFAVAHWNQASGPSGGTPVSIHAIEAEITGAIYYWNLGQGQMERIDASGRAPAIPNPPRRSDGTRCVACHTVSHDGRYLSGSLWGGGLEGAVFDLGNPAIKTSDPAPTVGPLVEGTSYKQLFSTFNPDATRLLVNNGTGMLLIDPRNGASVATQGVPLPAANSSHPAWSPDGSSIVFVNNITNAGGPAPWAVDYDRGDLQIIPVTGADTFGAPGNLVPAAAVDPAFAAPSWPSFAPDSAWIAYGAGSNSRGQNGVTTYPGSLFLVNKSGGATVRLDTACGGARVCYLPNFSPYDAGGYYWLVFYSFRDYGNTLAGSKGSGRRQMWITAIDKSKLGTGQDPSAVSYWVPDQDVATANMSAFWALPPPVQ